ncbi:DNA repair protein RadA/Sms [Treponema bryantii]|uniref:DNA repair protein RadA n=1 Tax=Treponema bryantii TaxID=163 RepID=A0A1H9CMK7_9SPIR|nr:DNA repair protein RadA [Treponema bryantii]SEQ01838.1 DNA repair protein RadA/Sms [Treponema bryantii]
MAKKSGSVSYRCSNCGYTQPRWLGRCPECGEWNSLEEIIIDKNNVTPAGRGSEAVEKQKPVGLASVKAQENSRLSTGIDEFDRVLGGGATKRSAILLGGEPGIGKSTLLLQTAASVAQSGAVVLYISGEESAAQIKERADRLELSCNGISILCTSRLEDSLDALDSLNPAFVIIDSIQTIYSAEAGIIPGTVNQLKYCANEFISWAKERDTVLIMTAHVTKEGTIAGPKSLEHMVDTVISFERNADDIRFLHAQKNRFGSVDEIGIFSMSEKGLTPVLNPASLFLTQRKENQPAGVACTPVFEGSRVFLVEIQALTVPAKASVSRIYSEKIDSGRVARVAAVIEKRCGLCFSDQDIYVNVAGGIKLSESAIDAALAAALYSARTDIPVKNGTAVFGELSLAGEIRPVNKAKQRIKAAESLGFNQILSPQDGNNQGIADIKTLIKTIFR